jgi:hypothetical protein
VPAAIVDGTPHVKADRRTGGDELGRSESFVGMREKRPCEPAVLRYVVILEKELAARSKQSSDLAERSGPICDMVDNGEVHNDIKEATRKRQGAHVTKFKVHPVALGNQAVLRATNHLRVDIDSRDLSFREVNKQQLDADTLPTPHFKNSLRVG